tara:strand:+ start:709 stop:948 length:240 start_codon:yes stop_codon:yes gene_type:complete
MVEIKSTYYKKKNILKLCDLFLANYKLTKLEDIEEPINMYQQDVLEDLINVYGELHLIKVLMESALRKDELVYADIEKN